MSKKVLVVEDDTSNRALVKKCLSKGPYEIFEADNGEDAIKTFASELPDLVVLDIELPGIKGKAVLENIRNSSKRSDIPIIIITSHDELNLKREYLEAGANEWLQKPFSTREFREMVKGFLG